MRVKFTNFEQADLTEMQALADSAEDNGFGLVNALLFSSDYRIKGALVSPTPTPSGVVTTDPGVFVKADGKFYTMPNLATMNILAGTENQAINVWGTGVAADATNPRKDIIVVTQQFVDSVAAVKNFIDTSVNPPVQYTQSVPTRRNSMPLFSVLHGTPSATPVEPALPSGYMKLATIVVPANATTITSGDVINNLNIDIKTLEQIQQASQAQSAFSDLLHGDGVYGGVLGQLAVTETSPQAMQVSVATGVALQSGVTARISTATTIPVSASSFAAVSLESVTFNVDTKTLQTNGTPPHKIRSGTVVISGKTEGIDYTINYSAGTITRLGGGSIPGGGTVSVSYDYFLPRIDRVELVMANSTPMVTLGTPAQTPIAPPPTPNAMTLAYVAVAEGVTVIVNANITDARILLSNMNEVIASRGSQATLQARLAVSLQAGGALVNTAVTPGSYGSATQVPLITVQADGRITGVILSTIAITSANLDSVVAAGSHGSQSSVSTFTVDAKGRLTAAGDVSIQIGGAQVSGGTLGAVNGSAITNLNGSQIASGTVSDVRLSGNVTLMGNAFNGASQLVQLDGSSRLPAVNGVLLTNITGANVTGTVASAASATFATTAGGAPPTGSAGGSLSGTYPNPTTKLPTRQVKLSGSGTYTAPAGVRQISVRMVGGGGGGGAGITNDGTDGNITSFDSSNVTAAGGGKGHHGHDGTSSGGIGGTGGTGSGTTGPTIRIAGGDGGCGINSVDIGGIGGSSHFGGAGSSGLAQTAGGNGKANSGGGGGGGGAQALSIDGGGGGGGGEYVEFMYSISLPGPTNYSYTIAGSASGGAASGLYAAGGDGASGIIIIDEIY